MPNFETNTRKIIARLQQEGWVLRGGAKHAVYVNPDRPGISIVIPRHTEQSIGLARRIYKQAGWL
jgi:predicted RNA binding protein YcfA (HicA-like mRNA interferase family)